MRGIVAIVGCDGSGKSRLSADLVAGLRDLGATEFLYLGQSSGNILEFIRGIPGVGPAIGRYLKRRSARAHADDDRPAEPDLATALVVYLLSRWRYRKFRRMLAMLRRGAVVVTDRYPQAEAQGFYFDGPGLSPTNGTGLVRALAQHEHRLYRRMAAHRPALVIRLNVDVETAASRKPDHKPSMLRDKVRVIPTLAFGGAPILDLDGRSPYPQVLESALRRARVAIRAEQPSGRDADPPVSAPRIGHLPIETTDRPHAQMA